MNEQEIAKLTTAFITENVKVIGQLSTIIYSKASEKVRLRLERSYERYLNRSSKKFSRTKSFFFRDVPADLYDFYVPIDLANSTSTIRGADYKKLEKNHGRVVITGTGGCGKSVLMKHLFLTAIGTKTKVPIFIELRDLNASDASLDGLIYRQLNSTSEDFSPEYIRAAKEKGHFAFLVDGFDEVAYSIREKLIEEIKALSRSFPDCTMIISSRPDDLFQGIDEFTVFKVQRLSLNRAKELVQKLPFDGDVKKKFISELNNGLYDSHRSFLSNPLLLSIMLMTYGQNAEIPTKLSIFYNQAYEALFQRHDAQKGGYRRQRKTSLDIQDFAKVFSVFCLQTYDTRVFSFSQSDALALLSRAREFLQIDFNSGGYLEDSIKATCLLMEDGLEITFSHRSFQEYFVALYIRNAPPDIQVKLIKKYWANLRSDQVISLLYEMDSDLVERELLIPNLKIAFDEIGVKRRVGITHFIKHFKKIYSKITIDRTTISATCRSVTADASDAMSFAVSRAQGNIVDSDLVRINTENIIDKYCNERETLVLETDKISIKTPLMREVAFAEGFFSINFLQSAYDELQRLIQKHGSAEQSLNQLLSHD